MHARLVGYLRDNRDHIVENWLTEVEIPAPIESKEAEGGVIPYAFFAAAFDAVLERIENGAKAKPQPMKLHMDSFLGQTCDCRARCFGGRVCMELHDSGLEAYMSVFSTDWDAEHEFNELDRECCKDLINHALSGFFAEEVDRCQHKHDRSDCPFIAHN